MASAVELPIEVRNAGWSCPGSVMSPARLAVAGPVRHRRAEPGPDLLAVLVERGWRQIVPRRRRREGERMPDGRHGRRTGSRGHDRLEADLRGELDALVHRVDRP